MKTAVWKIPYFIGFSFRIKKAYSLQAHLEASAAAGSAAAGNSLGQHFSLGQFFWSWVLA
jgi:hypothetical protein